MNGRIIYLMSVTLAVTIHSSWAEEAPEFTELTQKFESLMLQHQVRYEGAKKTLGEGYEKHLKNLQEEFAGNSDLESAVRTRKELIRFADSKKIADEDLAETPESLASAQQKFRGALSKHLAILESEQVKTYTAYTSRLDTLKSNLTKANQLENALAVSNALTSARAELASLEEKLQARNKSEVDPKASKPKTPVPADAVEWNGHHYKNISHKKISFEDAKAACEAIGGHLVYLEDRDEQEFVADLITSRSTRWIGGSDADRESRFTWLDGSPLGKDLKNMFKHEDSDDRDYLYLNDAGSIGCRTDSGYRKNYRYQWVYGYVCEWDY